MNIQILILLPIFYTLHGSPLECKPCVCYFRKNIKKANCKSAIHLKTIPETLNVDIQNLNFEGQSLRSLEENNFLKFGDLIILNLRNNEIENVHEGCFKNLSKLNILYLSDNIIETLPVGIFLDTPNIAKIFLEKNKLVTLEDYLFFNLHNLKTLHLQENDIMYVAENSFSKIPLVNEINLSSNMFERLPNKLIEELNSLKFLYLHNNPWHCGEDTCMFREYALKKNWEISMPYCETPSNVTGKSWKELKTYAVSITASNTRAREGENITFICEFAACIRSTLMWKTNENEYLSAGTHNMKNKYVSTLHLTNLDISHEKTYICSVANCNECKDAEIYLKVTKSEASPSPIRFFFLFLFIIIITFALCKIIRYLFKGQTGNYGVIPSDRDQMANFNQEQ